MADIDLNYESRIWASDFDNLKELYTVPDSYFSSDDYLVLKKYIHSNYVVPEEVNFDKTLKEAIIANLVTQLENRNGTFICFGTARNIIKKGWQSVTTEVSIDKENITSFFLLYATKDTPENTLQHRH